VLRAILANPLTTELILADMLQEQIEIGSAWTETTGFD
jgi:hypothetical protein